MVSDVKRRGSLGRRRVALLVAASVFGLIGCSVPVASGLEESDANEVVLRLDHASIDATKEIDPTVEGKFRVTVAQDDTPAAVEALHSEGLPRVRPKGVMDTTSQGSLLPGPESEHAQLEAGRAGEFERSLLGVEGVTFARVHLSLPSRPLFGSDKEGRATASVLIAQHESRLTQESVQRLIAGGVPNLAREDVQVVFVQKSASEKARNRELAHVGPIAVAAGSRALLQGLLAGTFFLLIALASILALREARAARRIRELEGDKAR